MYPIRLININRWKRNRTMKKILATMMVFTLTIGALAQNDDGMDAMLAAMIAAKIHQNSIDTSSLVAVYDYECQTQDADGKAVTDRMKLCLQVVGIAAWDKHKATLKAIAEEQMPYPQIINSDHVATDLYGIDAIPEIILFAPDGKIVSRGLRGEGIGRKMKEIFGE